MPITASDATPNVLQNARFTNVSVAVEGAPGNDLGLAIQQSAITRLVVAQLPLQVLQALDIAFEALLRRRATSQAGESAKTDSARARSHAGGTRQHARHRTGNRPS